MRIIDLTGFQIVLNYFNEQEEQPINFLGYDSNAREQNQSRNYYDQIKFSCSVHQSPYPGFLLGRQGEGGGALVVHCPPKNTAAKEGTMET